MVVKVVDASHRTITKQLRSMFTTRVNHSKQCVVEERTESRTPVSWNDLWSRGAVHYLKELGIGVEHKVAQLSRKMVIKVVDASYPSEPLLSIITSHVQSKVHFRQGVVRFTWIKEYLRRRYIPP